MKPVVAAFKKLHAERAALPVVARDPAVKIGIPVPLPPQTPPQQQTPPQAAAEPVPPAPAPVAPPPPPPAIQPQPLQAALKTPAQPTLAAPRTPPPAAKLPITPRTVVASTAAAKAGLATAVARPAATPAIRKQPAPGPAPALAQRPVPIAKLVSAPDADRARPLVAVDEQALLAAGLMPPPQQQRRMHAEYRQIKRPLLARMQGRHAARVPNGHLIMVSSALPGEGKTFTSINLALSMALEKDLSVLLVDADVTKPHVSSLFGIDRLPGLLDALQDSTVPLREVILPTSIPRLSLMSAGRKNEDATELLASAGMDRLIEAIGKQYPNTVVLFDASPLLLTIEPRVLAQVVGQIVVVVRAGVTSHAELSDAIATIGQKHAIGLVLNQCEKPSAHGYYYGYAAAEAGSDAVTATTATLAAAATPAAAATAAAPNAAE